MFSPLYGHTRGQFIMFIYCRGNLEGISAAFYPNMVEWRIFFLWIFILFLYRLLFAHQMIYIFQDGSCFVSFLPHVSGESPLVLDSDRFRISFTKHEALVLDGSSGRVVTFGTPYRLDEYVCSWPSYCTHTGTISLSIQAGDALFPSKNQYKRPFQTVIFFFFFNHPCNLKEQQHK